MIIRAHGLRLDVPDWFASVTADDPDHAAASEAVTLTVRVAPDAPPVPQFDVDAAVAGHLHGSLLTIWPLDDALGPLTVEHYALDHMIPIALGITGHTVLHASGIALDGRGVVCSGPSGAGKSTLALWLATHGWRWLGDDAVRVTRASQGQDPHLTMWPSYPGARIHPDGQRDLFASHASTGPVAEYAAKERLVVPEDRVVHDPVPLDLLVVMDPDSRPGRPELVPLSMAEVASAIAQQSFLPRVDDRLVAIERLDAALTLAPLIPGVRLLHPRTQDALPEIADLIAVALDPGRS